MDKKIKAAIKSITPKIFLDGYHHYKERGVKRRQQEIQIGVGKCLSELNEKRSIDLGKFLLSVQPQIILPDLTFIVGGALHSTMHF